MVDQFKPLTEPEWPESIRNLHDGFAGRLNIYRTMAHHPALLTAWAPLRQHVVRDRAMTDQQSEVVILRTGHNLRSGYEWAHHVSRGRSVGMSEARIAALAGPLDAMADEDRVLARAVDELVLDARLSASARQDLIGLIGPDGMFDLMATVGFYSVLGFIANSLEVPVDDDIVAELQTRPAPEAN